VEFIGAPTRAELFFELRTQGCGLVMELGGCLLELLDSGRRPALFVPATYAARFRGVGL